MADVVVTDDPEPDPAEVASEESQVESVAVAAGAAAVAETARQDAEQSREEARLHSEGTEHAAQAAADGAAVAADAARISSEARDETLAAVEALGHQVAEMRAAMAELNKPAEPILTPAPEPTEDVEPGTADAEVHTPKKSHWLNRRWGAKS